MRRLAVLLVLLLAAAGCDLGDVASQPYPNPHPVAIVAVTGDGTNWDEVKCVVGIGATGFGIWATGGLSGVAEVLAWGFTGWTGIITTSDCWNAANTDWQNITIAFTCDGSTIFPVTFDKFVDVTNFMKYDHCVPPAAWAMFWAAYTAGIVTS